MSDNPQATYYVELDKLKFALELATVEWDQAIFLCDDNKQLAQGEDYIRDSEYHARKRVVEIMEAIGKLAVEYGCSIVNSGEPLACDWD